MLRGFDQGADTRFPSFAGRNTAWTFVANQPTKFQVFGNSSAAGMGVVTTSPYYGDVHFRCGASSGGSALRAAVRRHYDTALSESYISLYVNFSLLVATRDIFSLRTAADAIVVQLSVSPTGQLLVYAGTVPTLKATIEAGFTNNTWYHIELHTKTGVGALAELDVKISDGAETDCGGTTMDDWYYAVLGNYATGVATGVFTDYAALQVNDISGSLNNSWPGASRIPAPIRPSADDATSDDWVPSSGSDAFAMIDESQPDLDTTYIQSTTDGDDSLYEFTDVDEPDGTLFLGVKLTTIAKRSDLAYITPYVKRGGSTATLSALKRAIGSDYMNPLEFIIEQDPIASAAWTEANINASEFGFIHSTS